MAAAVQAARDLPALLAQSLRSARENCRVHHAPPCWMRLQQVTNHSTGEGAAYTGPQTVRPQSPPPPGRQAGGLAWKGRLSTDRNKQKLGGSVGHLCIHPSICRPSSSCHLSIYPPTQLALYTNTLIVIISR